jgi:Cysteine rich repeat
MFRVTPLALTVILAASTASAQPSAAMRQACEADYRRLCATVIPGGGRILKCLLDHNNELAPECRAVLQQRSE